MAESVPATRRRLRQIGQQIRQAREAIGHSPKNCAKRAGISSRRWLAYEAGEAEPTLSELELIAGVLQVPPHVLLGELPSCLLPSTPLTDVRHWLRLRGHIIGARLKQARLSCGKTVEQVAAALGLKPSQMKRIEAGRQPPITVLEQLMQHYNLSLDALLDLGVRPLGDVQARLLQRARFEMLDDALRSFVADPSATPFLRLAMHLRALPPHELDRIGKALLTLSNGISADAPKLEA